LAFLEAAMKITPNARKMIAPDVVLSPNISDSINFSRLRRTECFSVNL